MKPVGLQRTSAELPSKLQSELYKAETQREIFFLSWLYFDEKILVWGQWIIYTDIFSIAGRSQEMSCM